MKTWLSKGILGVLLVAATYPAAVRAQSPDNDGCSDASLKGEYAFTISGQIFKPMSPVVTREGVAITHFDGWGSLTQVDFVMQYPDMSGGSSQVPGSPDGDSFNTGETGSYTVYPDCTGIMEIDFPPVGAGGPVIQLRIVLSDGGRIINTEVLSVYPHGVGAPSVPALIHSQGRKLKLPADSRRDD